MKYKISENQDGIDISVNDIKTGKEKLVEAFRECREGKCSCPTEEYKKLDSLEMEEKDDSIQLKLKSRQGEKIVMSEIEKCLDYTSERIEGKE